MFITFKVLANRVMRSSKEEKYIRQQKVKEKKEQKIKCFRYWGVGHCKWKCPNIKVERRRQEREAMYVIQSQNMQQKRRPV